MADEKRHVSLPRQAVMASNVVVAFENVVVELSKGRVVCLSRWKRKKKKAVANEKSARSVEMASVAIIHLVTFFSLNLSVARG